jgi:peptide chain release factor 1
MLNNRLDKLSKRLQEVETSLSNPATIADTYKYKALMKEHSYLQPIIKKFNEFKSVQSQLEELKELLTHEGEMKQMAEKERTELKAKKEMLESQLRLDLLPPDPNDGKDVIVEIRAGTGGDEAALFAAELFRMYMRFAEQRGWKTEIFDSNPIGIGGVKEVIFSITGTDVWKSMKFERGTHRVQRVPVTEASGRVHTSAVTVAVLPEAEDIEVDIKPEDLRIDTYRASGAGGQHVNKTDSAIRITHNPTGIIVACQDERSQIKNRAKAMRVLKAKILEAKQNEQSAAISKDRKQQVGSGDRSEKIRTYNFPQNRITDHRIELSLYRLKEIMEGDLGELTEKLINSDNEKKLSQSGE